MPGGQVDAAVATIRGALGPDGIVGVYLFGSAIEGGLRPDSDLDLLVLSGHALRRDEKASLVDGLRPISRRSLRPSGWRPLEVTVVHQVDVRPWRYPPRLELQYGEWLTDEDLGAQLDASATPNPDLAVLIAMVRAHGHALIGPPPREVLDPVPREDLIRAIRDEVPALLDDLEDDTRNVLLTLARAWATVTTGAILSKDAAADWALGRLPPPLRPALARARDLYLGGGYGDWADAMDAARELADAMAAEVHAAS
ncbi:MAG TPA: aminoglycoside adenylyltransferase family protein [Candidatus Limnocylindrales bacterium]|nr:aminoglycoside adenylyltransferase family protein [Candidatus Limnocylindrales bacterium]